MVQILPEVESFGSRLGKSLGQGAGQGLLTGMATRKKANELAGMSEFIKKEFGYDLREVPEEFRKTVAEKLLGSRLSREEEAQKLKGKGDLEDERYKTVLKYYGQKQADLYKAASEGGKTAMYNSLIKREARGEFENELNEDREEAGVPVDVESDQKEQGENFEIPSINPKKTKMDYDRGLTKEEKVKRQDDRYRINLPLITEMVEKKRAAEAESDNLKILKDLSPKIAGVERININPQSGDLFLPAAASAEAQRYVKTINDFTRNAKDSYGSRVTNFDLIQFMKRLPTLANSEEGREQIIQQLEIINDINLAHANALQEVIDDHGGIRNVDFDVAERLADKRSAKEVSRLKKEFQSIGSSLDREESKEISKIKKTLPKGQVLVRFNDGHLERIPSESVKEFLSDKAGEVL